MNKKMRNTLIALGILFALGFIVVQNFEYLYVKLFFQPAEITVKAGKIYIDNGVLGDESFHDDFVRVVGEHPEIKTVVLGNIPGSINDELNLKTCLFLYEKGLNTELLSNSVIESGAVDLFVSGRKLNIVEGAKIGVHSWEDIELGKSALDIPRSHPVHQTYLNLYNQVHIDTSFYWFTLRVAPPEDIHYMNEQEIEKYFGSKITTLVE